jgi:hypothetical protein
MSHSLLYRSAAQRTFVNMPDVAPAGPGHPTYACGDTSSSIGRAFPCRASRHGTIAAASECTPTLPRPCRRELPDNSHGSWGGFGDRRRLGLPVRRQVEMPRGRLTQERAGEEATPACQQAGTDTGKTQRKQTGRDQGNRRCCVMLLRKSLAGCCRCCEVGTAWE